MDQNNLHELYKLHEKAKRMERLGNDTEALNVYLQIHENFFANTSDLYERPSIILEKKHRYDEAIAMCEKAIKLINEGKISGTIEQFQKRLDHIEGRLNKNGGSSKRDQKSSKFKLQLNPKKWGLLGWLKFLGVLIILVGGLYLLLPKSSPYDDLNIDLSEMERESELEGSLFNEANNQPYPITAEMIQTSVDIFIKNVEVVDANIIPQENTIGLAIITTPGTSKDTSEALAVEFIKVLSGVASAEYLDLSGPNALSFGELYNYYDLVISVGDSPENIITKGTKNKNASLINWRDE